MKLTKDTLRERRIFNQHYLAALQDEPQVWVSYRAGSRDRFAQSPAWQVHRIGYKTDKDAHFMDHGSKTIDLFGLTKEEARLQAVEWASERYNIHEWERSPFGSYHPVGTLARAAALETDGTADGT